MAESITVEALVVSQMHFAAEWRTHLTDV